MVIVSHQRNLLGEALGEVIPDVAKSAVKTYERASDERALKQAVSTLTPKSTQSDIVRTIMNTHTYEDQPKKDLLDRLLKIKAGETQHERDIELENKRKETELSKIKESGKQARKTEGVKQEGKVELGEQKEGTQIKVIQARAEEARKGQAEKHQQAMEKDKSGNDFKEKLENIRQTGKVTQQEMKGLNDQQRRQAELQSKDSSTRKKENVKEFKELQKTVGEFKGLLSRVPRIEQLIEATSGLNAWRSLASSDAAELEEWGIQFLRPQLKFLNPTGAIAHRKIEFLFDKVGLRATDLKSTQLGKLRAGQQYMQMVVDQDQKLMDLYAETDYDPTPQQLADFSRGFERQLDLINQVDVNTGMVSDVYNASTGKKLKSMPYEDAKRLVDEGLASPTKPTVRQYKSAKTGAVLHIPEEQAQKLLEQGKIVYE